MDAYNDVTARAALSGGTSDTAIHALVARVVREAGLTPGTFIDVGCGTGSLFRALEGTFQRYVGVDIVAYEGFPHASGATFVSADLNMPPFPLKASSGDVVAAVETIEHLENPRALFRELVRLARPGGLVVVTTPNQLSLLSKLTLVVKNEFNAFQTSAGLYPAHLTALLEQDLRNIAHECGLDDVRVHYTDAGRIPGTARHWPGWLGLKGRWFSDNVLIRGFRSRSLER